MPDEYGQPTNPEIAEIYHLIKDGDAFINRVEPDITSAALAIADQLLKLVILAAIPDDNLIPNWDQIDLIDLVDELTTLNTTLGDLLTHTNRISGVTLNFQSPSPSSFTLTSVTTSLQEIEEAINDGEFTNAIDQFFGSLVSMPILIEGIPDFLFDLDLKIQQIAPYDPPYLQPMPIDTIQTIKDFYEPIPIIIDQENANFDIAMTKINRWAYAGFLIQPDVVWRDFIVDTTATDALAALIPEIEEES